MSKYWIQESKKGMKKGALHKQLGISEDKKISPKLLEKIVETPIGKKVKGKTVTRLLKQRANWALNVRG
jgi:hypothetical protein